MYTVCYDLFTYSFILSFCYILLLFSILHILLLSFCNISLLSFCYIHLFLFVTAFLTSYYILLLSSVTSSFFLSVTFSFPQVLWHENKHCKHLNVMTFKPNCADGETRNVLFTNKLTTFKLKNKPLQFVLNRKQLFYGKVCRRGVYCQHKKIYHRVHT